MKKSILLIVLSIVLSAPAFASDFTVDERSILHFGASAGIAATADVLLYENGVVDPVKRKAIAGLTAFSVGFIKELTDDDIDMGDMAFNALGIGAGLMLGEWMITFDSKDDYHGATLHGTW
jgi:hypothetical protein